MNQTLHADLEANEQTLREIFDDCSDIVFSSLCTSDQTKILLIYVEGLVDTNLLNNTVLKPWVYEGLPDIHRKPEGIGENRVQQMVAIAKTKVVTGVPDLVDGVMKGNVAILFNGKNDALLADLKGFEKRAVEESRIEFSVRGPKDSFTEVLQVNTSLVRRRIQSPKLKMIIRTLGELSKTDVIIAYVEGIATDSVIKEVINRVERIQIDSVLETGYIEEFIEDQPFSPFPQLQNTERPDTVAASLLEGRVAIFQDGTPSVLIVPMTFWMGLQAAEDYYEHYIYKTFIRWLRIVVFHLSLFLPSLYVAVTTYHPQLIPTNLLISIASSREGVPLPAIAEALIMELMFEVLLEAGVRIPKPIGQAVSIVGALVIGQAAVQAGIVSAPMVIVVAATGISSFVVPRYNLGTAFRILRFPLLLLASVFGLYGIVVGAIAIVIHLVTLQSFGLPYFSPVAPQIPRNLGDTFIRVPRWSMKYRPALFSGRNKTRIPEGRKLPPKKGNS
ncbi:spore germination protein [Brevibacillus sp. NRS-1366]|uniref:spore germination protein n=1 Tax=Brevibacillus sp. NRS-1366 TaxID=3233899 RepID=UPI003D21A92C